jgi:hypothetical protein
MFNLSPQQLTYDSFYYGSKDPFRARTYKHFLLKVSFPIFMVLWKSMESLRAICYSHYIRSHYCINKPSQRYSRFALSRQWRRYFRFKQPRPFQYKRLCGRFILNLYRRKYQIYIFETLNPSYDTPSWRSYEISTLAYKNNYIRFLINLARMPTNFFKRFSILSLGVYFWLGFLATSIMARYTNNFVQFTRFDYDHAPILYKTLSISPFGRNRIVSMWLAEWKEKLFNHFMEESNFTRLFTVLDFLLMKTGHSRDAVRLFPWVGCPRFLFTHRVNRFFIKDNKWDVSFIHFFTKLRWVDGHIPGMGDYWHVYKDYWKTHWLRHNYLGKFYPVDVNLLRNPLDKSYYQWRIFNITPVYKFLQGRLPLFFYYRKLELDYYIYYRYKWLWNVFKKTLPSRYFHTFCEPKFHLRKKFDSSAFLSTPFPLHHRSHRAVMGWYSKYGKIPQKSKVSLKLTSFIGFSMIASFFVLLFHGNLFLNFINFFVLWNKHHLLYNYRWSVWQNGILTSLYINQWVIRQWISNYQNKWPHYRRKISKSGIHSLKDPFYRENWMRVFHKARRTGFKKHQLPYYCYDESKDLILDLASLIRTSPNKTVFNLPGILLIDEVA